MNDYEHNHRDITVTEEENGLVIFNLQNGTVSRLNAIGKLIWDGIPKESIEEIVNSLADGYDVQHAQADHDVREFIAALLRDGLIVARQKTQPK